MDKKNIAASSTLALALSVFSASYSLAAISKVPEVTAPATPSMVSAPPGLEGRVSPTASFLHLGDGHFALRTPDAPAPGQYSQARLVDMGSVYALHVSGQTGNDPKADKEKVVEGGLKDQTAQALKNIGAMVKAAGGDLRHITDMTVYLKNLEIAVIDNQPFEEAYGEFFDGVPYPARATVGGLHIPFPSEGTVVEIKATAYIPKNKASQ